MNVCTLRLRILSNSVPLELAPASREFRQVSYDKSKALLGRRMANLERRIKLHHLKPEESKRWRRLYEKTLTIKSLQRAGGARRRCARINSQPAWVAQHEIAAIYKTCVEISKRTGVEHHVDHIVPLRGRKVCGLHVPWNLQVIPSVENLRKGNKFD